MKSSEPATGHDNTGVQRIEAPAKVTGAARYAADRTLTGMLHAVLVGAPASNGTVTEIDTAAARAVPGVVAVLTETDMPRFGDGMPPAAQQSYPLQDRTIKHEGQPVAVVVAETLQAAETARAVVTVHIEHGPFTLLGDGDPEDTPDAYPIGKPVAIGDVGAALHSSAHVVRARYTQPARHHNAMETSAIVAAWSEGSLTVWDSTQSSANVSDVLTATLAVDPADLRVVARYVGGGFGAKAFVWPHEVIAAATARIVDRPVKLHVRRADQYSFTGFQPPAEHNMVLAADHAGRLTAVQHEMRNSTSFNYTHVEPGTEASMHLYATPALATRQWLTRAHTPAPTPMRAPMEGVGLWALEGAMNELAHTAGIDPLELRLRNHADTDPLTGRPWSSKHLRQAYQVAADDFGWHNRAGAPRRDGVWLLGRGMATCTMGTIRFPGHARVRLSADGRATVEVDIQDIGTGSQTVFAQLAAEELGMALDDVSVTWGDSHLPRTSPLYSSSGTLHTGSAVALACRALREKLNVAEGENMLSALKASGLPEIDADGDFTLPDGAPIDFDGGDGQYAMRTFGTVFVEVGVDPDTGVVRLRRAVGAYATGRVLNQRTARAQMIGGITWGWGKAVMEASPQDPATGRWLSKNLSAVHVPVNADIPAGGIAVHLVDEYDPHASAIGVKGMGEISATGVDAAVADAVFDAVGIRIRDLPLNPPRVLAALAAAPWSK